MGEGERSEPVQSRRPAALDATSGTPEMRPLSPRVRTVWWLTGAVTVGVAMLPVLLVDLFAPVPLPNGVLTVLFVGFWGAVAAVVPVVRYRRWRYALRPHDLWIRRGVLSVSVSVIPYRRLQFVDTQQGPLDRMFGLAQLIVHTAAIGTSGRVPGLDAAEAERLRETLASLEPDDALV
jgi:membrane protein YdbS with pleckstrin-like domain